MPEGHRPVPLFAKPSLFPDPRPKSSHCRLHPRLHRLHRHEPFDSGGCGLRQNGGGGGHLLSHGQKRGAVRHDGPHRTAGPAAFGNPDENAPSPGHFLRLAGGKPACRPAPGHVNAGCGRGNPGGGGHPSPDPAGGGICPAGIGDYRRTAPLWSGTALPAQPKRGASPLPGDERHPHPPDPGADDVRGAGPFGDPPNAKGPETGENLAD